MISAVVRGTEQKLTISLCLLDNDTFGVSECLSRVSESFSEVSWSVSECLSRVSESWTWLLFCSTWLPTWLLFPSPNRDDKFLCLVIIHKCDIDIFVQCTSDAATRTSVWQQVYSIIEKEHIARHRGSCVYLFQYIVHHSLIHSLFNKSFTSTFSKSEIRLQKYENNFRKR